MNAPPSLRAELVATAHRLAAAGLVMGTIGNLSVRRGSRMLISASGARLDTLTESELTELSLEDGKVVDGTLRPSSESGLHLAVYRQRAEAGAIVHTHAPWSTAIACARDELPSIHYQMLALGGAVRVAPYRCFGTPELAQVTLTALEGRSAVLMANHGATVFGANLAAAFEAAQTLEFACALYWRAAQLGTPHALDAAQWREVTAQVARLGYGVTHPR
ncbi:MAG TPA: class II aldolase/adducin family protein [Nevskiaceae bacterium]